METRLQLIASMLKFAEDGKITHQPHKELGPPGVPPMVVAGQHHITSWLVDRVAPFIRGVAETRKPQYTALGICTQRPPQHAQSWFQKSYRDKVCRQEVGE